MKTFGPDAVEDVYWCLSGHCMSQVAEGKSLDAQLILIVLANFWWEHGNGNSYPRDRIGLDFPGEFFFKIFVLLE